MDEPITTLVRQHDPDRFLTALFAPAGKRDALLTLYAFNHELARAREVASEPMLALIRLQWWREVVEGAPRRHPVATPLRATLDAGLLRAADLLALIEAREQEAEPEMASLDVWRGYVLGSAGGLAVAAARLLDAPEPEAARAPGAAYGVAGLLRSLPMRAAQGRMLLPADLLAAQGLSVPAALAAPDAPGVQAVARQLAEEGRALLRRGRQQPVPPPAIAAVLPAVLARRDLARWPIGQAPTGQGPAGQAPTGQAPTGQGPRAQGPRAGATPRGLGDRLAVTVAGLRGRL
jgi:phytoene synthase